MFFQFIFDTGQTILPFITVYRTLEKTSNGFPSYIAKSPSLPVFILPRRWSTRHIFAASMVIARKASYSLSPSFAANAAQRGRYCIRDTGWSVVIATVTPCLRKTPEVLKSNWLTSFLFRDAREGPTIAGKPDAAISFAIRCPSVQWSKVTEIPNSFAIRITVSISSAR